MLGTKDIVFEDGVESYLQSCRGAAEKAENIFLFGSARGGVKAYQYLQGFGLHKKIRHVVDNDVMKQGADFYGIRIISVETMQEMLPTYPKALILIASGSAHIIKKQLLECGIPESMMHPFAITMLQTSPTPCEYFLGKKQEIEKVYSVFADEKSKNVFVSLLNFKMTRDASWLKKIADNEHDQYFDGLMHYTDEESFVDCGAYIGDTLDGYATKYGHWKNYYAFEADADVYEELKKHIAERGYHNVEVYNFGCWDSRTTLHFEKLGSGSSNISDESDGVEIRADSLDHALHGREVSVIKMDIEGAEQRALAGAKSLIAGQHPKLAISVYHSLDDFLHLPLVMQSFHGDYKIFLRHYRELTDSETICYAI